MKYIQKEKENDLIIPSLKHGLQQTVSVNLIAQGFR